MRCDQIAKEYCVGCGLCVSEMNVTFSNDESGFSKISGGLSREQQAFVENVCPVVGKKFVDSGDSVWGDNVGIYQGHSTDCSIRKKASSGGTITSLALFLLETNKVDGIIQIRADENNPIATVCIVCHNREEILECCGSRYCISSPWVSLKEKVKADKRYAAVGKPCDIAALKNAQLSYGLYPNIEYLISFFCAGIPSRNANLNLLSALGCSENSVSSLTYRGNGWPGYATSVDSLGNVNTMEYAKSWGGILGRDVHKYCRICIDGIGMSADVACGDGWYVKDNQPDFSERDGRNVIIARNDKGDYLLKEARDNGYLVLENWESIDDLQIIQKYQFSRRATMRAKLVALRIMGRTIPLYDSSLLQKYAKYASTSEKRKMFIGMIKRVIRRKI